MGERDANRLRLRQFVEGDQDNLHKILCHYLLRAGLAGDTLHVAADELLNEVVVEALKTAGRLRDDIHPRPWLLGIAANLIKRRQAKQARLEQREPLLRDLYVESEQTLSDEELFDQLPVSSDGSLQHMEANEAINLLFDGLAPDDQQIIRLAIIEDMKGEELGRALGVTANTAYQRLFRALNRLRSLRHKDATHE
ncbi:MAG: sigma-70 family RNA polymerase sigma factor [Anaerolineae bacterium]